MTGLCSDSRELVPRQHCDVLLAGGTGGGPSESAYGPDSLEICKPEALQWKHVSTDFASS
jgi:hypothetical protein